MNFQKRSKGRGGNGRGQKSHRPGSSASPPPQTSDFAKDGYGTDIYSNKYVVYSVTSNLGETARVQVVNGDIYEGILTAVSSKFDCILGEAHLVQQKKSNGFVIEDEQPLPSRDGLISALRFAPKDIVSVKITKTEEPEIATSIDSFTDAGITNAAQKQTNGQMNERELERWVPDGPDIGGGLEDNVKVNGWSPDEMFKTNQEKFGVTSTYNEDLLQYTTPLPKDSTHEMELKAEQTAREIEQSHGHLHRQEVDSGKTEEELHAAVVRPQTASTAPRTPQVSSGQCSVEGKPQREAAPETTPSNDEQKATDANTPAMEANAKPTSAVTVNTVNTVTQSSGGQSLKESSTEGQTASTDTQSSGPKAKQSEVMKDLKEFHSNFNLKEKPSKKGKEGQQTVPQEAEQAEAAATKTTASSVNESGAPSTPDVAKSDEKKDAEESILFTSKLNPNAKEFKFTPKAQKPTPPPPHYMSTVVPFSPTSMRPPVGPYAPHPPHMVMVTPPPLYRGKQPFNKPARNQSYGGGRDQGESSPSFISAAAATGNPIITSGGGFPQQMYGPIPPHQPVAYVQSHAGMLPQPMLQQQYVVPPGHAQPRFIAPVSSPAGAGTVPMSQTYQDGMPVYVAGAPMQSAGTPQGQPQPSPSQQGQFIFTSVPSMPGQPQAGAPPQGQVTPGPAPYGQPVVYIPPVAPNAVSTSTPSSVSYMPGEWQPFLSPNRGRSLIAEPPDPPYPSPNPGVILL